MIISSCTHDPVVDIEDNEITNIEVGPINTKLCNPDSVYFENDVHPIFIASCSFSGNNCHAQQPKAGEDLIVTNYKYLLKKVKAGKPSESKLLKILLSKDPKKIMPRDPSNGEGFSLSDEKISLIEKWILQGAPFNSCNECNEENFTYSGKVSKIINTSCATSSACHNTKSDHGDFSSYEGLKTVADNGLLKQRVLLKKNMPPTYPLMACEIVTLNNWLLAGALNN